jgi:hypothetical protein
MALELHDVVDVELVDFDFELDALVVVSLFLVLLPLSSLWLSLS